MSDSRLPVTVVTGFLGSGKTTLLRHLLSEGRQRLAVVVNEFGTVGLDGDLLKNCGFCPDDEVDERSFFVHWSLKGLLTGNLIIHVMANKAKNESCQ